MIVFDLDGTLADCRHRLRHIQGSPKDWDAFFAACVDDAPIAHMIENLKMFAERGHPVEVWTGRSETVRSETVEWFASLGVVVSDSHLHPGQVGHVRRLRMRDASDRRPDHVLKEQWLKSTEGAGRIGKPDMVFEDRSRVVEMWRANDVICVQVAPGDF